VRLHILHHAAEGPITGAAMIEDLAGHGYRLSPGTVYPMLRALETKGYLRSENKRSGRRSWCEYRATPTGRRSLVAAKAKLRELFHELIEESGSES
jgi:PadR family transcriptional regulator, regulatory protein PadR